MRTRVLILLAAVALGGCSAPGGDPSTPASPSAASTATAATSETSVPTAIATTIPSSATETPIPASSFGAPTEISGQLVARLTVYPDVYAGPVPPTVSLFADGHVITPRQEADVAARYFVRRLTASGLTRVVAEFDAALAALESSSVTADPSAGYGHGYGTYLLTVRRGDKLVTARVINASPPPGARAIVELGDRWLQPTSPVPTDAWLDSSPSPFVPTRWSLWLRRDGEFSSPAPDASVLSRLIGDPATFGSATEPSDWWTRCGIVGRAAAEGIAAGLVAAGAPEADLLERLDAAFRTGSGYVNLALVPALPDETSACPPAAP